LYKLAIDKSAFCGLYFFLVLLSPLVYYCKVACKEKAGDWK